MQDQINKLSKSIDKLKGVKKVALIMIVKATSDEAPHLERCLNNVSPHVDGIFLNVNHKPAAKPDGKIMRVAKKYTDNIIVTEWHDDFEEARNANLAQVPDDYDWILWLDTDDTIDKPEKIRKVVEASNNFDSIFVDYLYDRDEEQNPLTVHLIARMFKNNNSHRWRGRIHETLIERRGVTQGATKDFIVIHNADGARTQASFKRNARILKLQLEEEKNSPDPRTFYYLGSTLMDAGDADAAIELFEDYLTLSGWDQERSMALTKMGRIYLAKGDNSKAKECFARAIAEDPDNPEPRVEMGSLEVELQRYDKARTWLEYVETMEKNMTTLERNPMAYTFRTYLLLAECYLQLGGKYLDKAVEYSKKAYKYKKKSKDIKAWVKMAESVAGDYKLTKDILNVYKALDKNKEHEKQITLIQSIPKQLEDNPIFVKLRDKEPQTWPEKSVAIMTGDTMIDEWGPWSLDEGIGGSEEAIIRISKHLTDLGYKVVVFGKPGANAGLYDGVMWRNFWECNLEDTFDVFIGWRNPSLFEKDIKARKRYLWLHDVMEVGEFTDGRLSNLDKVMVLSKYHRSLFPNIPDDKIMMSANGIDPADFEELEDTVERDPHKVFYGSSHVRGLAYLYEIWPEVKAEVPEATLDVYYGRGSYDAVHRGNPERLKWMDDMMMKAEELDGVTDHGKVGQKEIVRHMFESGVWAYPCPFPEIYCITAIKAQAAGCVPVSSNFAALDETVQFGVKLTMQEQKEGAKIGKGDTKFLEEYKTKLIDMLKHPDKQEAIRKDMMAWARTNSWQKVAGEWDKEFQS